MIRKIMAYILKMQMLKNNITKNSNEKTYLFYYFKIVY